MSLLSVRAGLARQWQDMQPQACRRYKHHRCEGRWWHNAWWHGAPPSCWRSRGSHPTMLLAMFIGIQTPALKHFFIRKYMHSPTLLCLHEK